MSVHLRASGTHSTLLRALAEGDPHLGKRRSGDAGRIRNWAFTRGFSKRCWTGERPSAMGKFLPISGHFANFRGDYFRGDLGIGTREGRLAQPPHDRLRCGCGARRPAGRAARRRRSTTGVRPTGRVGVGGPCRQRHDGRPRLCAPSRPPVHRDGAERCAAWPPSRCCPSPCRRRGPRARRSDRATWPTAAHHARSFSKDPVSSRSDPPFGVRNPSEYIALEIVGIQAGTIGTHTHSSSGSTWPACGSLRPFSRSRMRLMCTTQWLGNTVGDGER